MPKHSKRGRSPRVDEEAYITSDQCAVVNDDDCNSGNPHDNPGSTTGLEIPQIQEDVRPTRPRRIPLNYNYRSRPKKKTKKGSAAMTDQLIPSKASRLPSRTFCDKCGAKKFAYEPPKFCCSGGEVRLAENEYPPELMMLFTATDEDLQHFKT